MKFGKRKKSHRAGSGEQDGCGKTTYPTLKIASQAQMYAMEHYHEEDKPAFILTQGVV